MNEMEERMCKRQASIFEKSRESFSSLIFIKLFMYSSFASGFDRWDYDPFMKAGEYVRLIGEEFPKMKKKVGTRYSESELHWMGYIYRALCIHRKASSKAIYHTIGPSSLSQLYRTYHTFGIDYCLERLDEYIRDNAKSDMEIYKEVRKKYGL